MDFKLYNQFTQLKNWLFPGTCYACAKELKRESPRFCTSCLESLPYLDNACHRCGEPLFYSDSACGKCLSRLPTFDQCFCPFIYETPISKQIQELKFSDHPKNISGIADLFLQELDAKQIALPEAIISVPMHVKGLRKRGFNQSLELAKITAKKLDIPLLSDHIKKIKDTERQTKQKLEQRRKNLSGCFMSIKKIEHKHVAIIDDVVTTGSTAEEISKILKKNGVDYIQVWGIAKTI